MRTASSRTARDVAQSTRRGLAMLELVLSLPILLMVMGLMILIGWAGAFKVRSQVHAREAVWRSIHRATIPGAGQVLPGQPGDVPPILLSVDRSPGQPYIQPPTAELALFDSHQVVRGPVLIDPQSGRGIDVNRDLLDPNLGLITGRALLERDFPLMASLPPHGYQYNTEFSILDNRWQFWQMGLASNRSRRTLGLYPDFLGLWTRITAEPRARFNRLAAQLEVVNRRQMDLFDRDRELGAYHRRYIDYYPNPPRGSRTCAPGELDAIADQLIRRIGIPRPRTNLQQAGIPGRLSQDFLDMYRALRDQARLQNDAQSAAAYTTLIQQLEAFQASLVQ
ncbi:MAG TPA: hypothetical protein DCE43_01005 [Planctomycetaceae bacterium]|nr:hypothetical protein [Planctomycetaceae bacterium]